MKYKVGDIVVLSEKGGYFESQGKTESGEIRVFVVKEIEKDTDIYPYGLECHKDGYCNVYCEDDIEYFKKDPSISISIPKKKPIKETKKEKSTVEPKLEEGTMKQIEEVLEKVYENKELRSSVVPLFIGNPGMGKTKIIEKFAKSKGAKLVELITSQMSPFEISGIAMPDKDSKKMTYYNFDKLETLKSGDILFFDELLNGNPIVLNACLTILEQRRLISGKKLPNVMIIAAANPQGMVPLTPQIKERFLWYNVTFDAGMWKSYMYTKYKMPSSIAEKLCYMIKDEAFINNNFFTPRSIDKAISMIAKDCPTPYEPYLRDYISELVVNKYAKRRITVNKKKGIYLEPGESMMWSDFLKKSKL